MNLKPCPACGDKRGELVESKGARFPYAVICKACGRSTPYVKLASVAETLWNDAKRAGSVGEKPKRR
jgi:hypothetical protein